MPAEFIIIVDLLVAPELTGGSGADTDPRGIRDAARASLASYLRCSGRSPETRSGIQPRLARRMCRAGIGRQRRRPFQTKVRAQRVDATLSRTLIRPYFGQRTEGPGRDQLAADTQLPGFTNLKLLLTQLVTNEHSPDQSSV